MVINASGDPDEQVDPPHSDQDQFDPPHTDDDSVQANPDPDPVQANVDPPDIKNLRFYVTFHGAQDLIAHLDPDLEPEIKQKILDYIDKVIDPDEYLDDELDSPELNAYIGRAPLLMAITRLITSLELQFDLLSELEGGLRDLPKDLESHAHRFRIAKNYLFTRHEKTVEDSLYIIMAMLTALGETNVELDSLKSRIKPKTRSRKR